MRLFDTRLALVVWACLVAWSATAQDRRPLPPVMRTLSDEVGVLSVEEGRKLAGELEGILKEDGIRVVLVIAETVRPEPIEDYARRLSQRWASTRGVDPARAIFMIVAVSDREMVVMPGSDLELEARLARSDVTNGLPPLFRQGRYYEALMSLTERLHGVIHERASLAPTP